MRLFEIPDLLLSFSYMFVYLVSLVKLQLCKVLILVFHTIASTFGFINSTVTFNSLMDKHKPEILVLTIQIGCVYEAFKDTGGLYVLPSLHWITVKLCSSVKCCLYNQLLGCICVFIASL